MTRKAIIPKVSVSTRLQTKSVWRLDMMAAGLSVSRAAVIKALMDAGVKADPTFAAAGKRGADLYKAAMAETTDMVE